MWHVLKRNKGFTLLEINLTMLVFAIALTGLLSIFPVGLREASMASSDVILATFADSVICTVRAEVIKKAAEPWSNVPPWHDEATFINSVFGSNLKIDGQYTIHHGNETEIENYLVDGNNVNLRYILTLEQQEKDERLYEIYLIVTDKISDDLSNGEGAVFKTAVFCRMEE